jgi:hypothetical protein
MTLARLRFAVAAEVFAVSLAAGATQMPVQVPTDVLKTCKNEVGARYLNVPMAYISVDQGSKTANGNYLVNWKTKPPEGKGSSGFCVVDPSFYVLRFEPTSGPLPGTAAVMSPEEALRICKDQAADRLRIVPMEDISVERGKDLADGSYLIHWTEKAQGGVGRSGSCIIASDGKVREFRFDKPAARP